MNPTDTTTKLLRNPTKCKLCGHTFKSDLLREAAVLGGNPAAKLQQVTAMTKPLMKHLETKHPDVIQQAQLTGGQFAGYLTLLAFECDEDVLIKMGSDYTRWQVHKLTARHGSIPDDERIRGRVKELFARRSKTGEFEPSFVSEEDVSALLIEMRDSIIEKDRYSPQRPAIDVN